MGLCLTATSPVAYSHIQIEKNVRAAPVVKAQAVLYSRQPYDPKATRLAPGYQGHDLVRLIEALRSRSAKAKRREAETSRAFEERTRRDVDAPLYGGLRTTSILAVRVPVLLEYDAERQTTQARLFPDDAAGGFYDLPTDKEHTRVVLNVDDREEIRLAAVYKARTASGAEATVVKATRYSYKVIFANPAAWKFEDLSIKVDLSRQIPAYEARQVKKSLRVLAIVRLRAPYFAQEKELKPPTDRRPIDETVVVTGVTADVLAFCIYDFKTGKVYKMFSL
jgi:hypothetical protein